MTSDLLRAVVAGMPEGFAGPNLDATATRAAMAPFHGHPLAPDTDVQMAEIDGVRIARLSRPTADESRGAALFIHGGAFVSCDLDAYLFYAEYVAEWTGLPVVAVDYRLAPEHRGPAALEDCLAAYRVLARSGPGAERLICIGDSCGGALALSTVMCARDEGLPLPAGVVTLSGWVDLDTAGYGTTPPPTRDPFISEGFLRARARDYVGPAGDPRAVWASPARGEFAGLPPLLAQVGATDLCRLDAERRVQRAQSMGVDARLDVVTDGIHGVQGLVNLGVPEAVRAWEAVGRFTGGLLATR